ncbi:hypothetical protein [Tunturiibacter psychrotolerans]|uniref:hypothetical protein n=1 Tax=Tunturiibacter psychrotolerans TaxID=3069686 RepID=UPI003D19EF02
MPLKPVITGWLHDHLGTILITFFITSLLTPLRDWVFAKVPVGYKHISLKSARKRLETLNRVHNNAYELVLEIVRIVANAFFWFYIYTGTCCLVMSYTLKHSLSVGREGSPEETLALLASLPFILCFSIVATVSIHFYPLLRLFRELTSFERTRAALGKTIAKLEVKGP